jgi:hypothetical protein
VEAVAQDLVYRAVLAAAVVLVILAPIQLLEVLPHQVKVTLAEGLYRAITIFNQAAAVALVLLVVLLSLQIWGLVATASPRQSQGHRSHAQAVVVVEVFTALALLAAQVVVVLATIRQGPQTLVVAAAEGTIAVQVALVVLAWSFFQFLRRTIPAQPQARQRLPRPALTQF